MHGPLVAEIKAGGVFQSYKEGIMTDEVAQKIFEENHKGLEVPDVGQVDLLQLKDPTLSIAEVNKAGMTAMATQELTHTVFLVGWGHDEEKNMSYWIMRNSYGDHWGMNGDFHVRMGFDDFGVESELSGYDVELL